MTVFRLLTLWFDYGQWPDVYEALTEGIKSIQIDNWLQVSSSHVGMCTAVGGCQLRVCVSAGCESQLWVCVTSGCVCQLCVCELWVCVTSWLCQLWVCVTSWVCVSSGCVCQLSVCELWVCVTSWLCQVWVCVTSWVCVSSGCVSAPGVFHLLGGCQLWVGVSSGWVFVLPFILFVTQQVSLSVFVPVVLFIWLQAQVAVTELAHLNCVTGCHCCETSCGCQMLKVLLLTCCR